MATEQQSRPTGISAERAEQLLKEIVAIRSVVGEETTAHLWLTRQLQEIGMTVEHYPVEGRKMPFVLGVIEGEGDGPGVLFDAHFDTVHAVPSDWSRDPWDAYVEDGVLYGRGAVDSKGSLVAMLMAAKAVVDSGQPRSGPIYFMSDSDGEDGFRGAALMKRPRRDRPDRDDVVGRGDEQQAGRDRLPRHLHLENHRDRQDRPPDRARAGDQRGDEDGEAGRGRRPGSPRAAEGRLAVVRAAGHDQRDPHPSRRRLGDPGPLRRRALGALASRGLA